MNPKANMKTKTKSLPAISLIWLVILGISPVVSARLKVVTTLQDLASITSSIGGDRLEVLALAKGYQDPHFVDSKPSFVLQLSRADLLIVAGLELEIGYLPPLLDQSRNERIHPSGAGYLDASKGCDVIKPAGQLTRAMGDVHPYGNPHYWIDPENGRIIAKAVAAKLSELDPAGADAFAKNLAAFETKLTAKEKEWDAKMAPYSGARIVTFHDSWPNFARHFKLEVVDHVEPKPGIPPTPTHTLDVINKIVKEGVKVILVEPYFDSKTPKSIAEKTGTTSVMFYPSVGGKPEIKDYFDLFDYDIDQFVAAMKGKK